MEIGSATVPQNERRATLPVHARAPEQQERRNAGKNVKSSAFDVDADSPDHEADCSTTAKNTEFCFATHNICGTLVLSGKQENATDQGGNT